MKNEPQLSAEMERKAEEVFEHYNGDGYANPCPRIPCDCQVKEYKHFLATALEEQKEEVIEELLKHMRKVMFEWHGTGWAMVDDYKERFLNRKDTNE